MQLKHTVQNGFTLIEMMITLAVIAVLLGVVAPSFTDFFDKNRLKRAAEEVYGLVARAKAETVTRNMDLFVTVNAATWCVGYAATAGCTCAAGLPPDTPDPDDAGACAVPVAGVNVLQAIDGRTFTDVTMTNADLTRRFDSVRGTTANGTISLVSGDWSLNIVLSSTGRVRICAPDADRTMGYNGC